MTMKERIQADKRVQADGIDVDSDGIWVYLEYGFQSDPNSQVHFIHEDTWTEVKRAMRYIVPCDCADCRKGIAK